MRYTPPDGPPTARPRPTAAGQSVAARRAVGRFPSFASRLQIGRSPVPSEGTVTSRYSVPPHRRHSLDPCVRMVPSSQTFARQGCRHRRHQTMVSRMVSRSCRGRCGAPPSHGGWCCGPYGWLGPTIPRQLVRYSPGAKRPCFATNGVFSENRFLWSVRERNRRSSMAEGSSRRRSARTNWRVSLVDAHQEERVVRPLVRKRGVA